ncbi:MAG: putative Ig domain-containing protein [Candidatus Dormiibacterota bacterium]
MGRGTSFDGGLGRGPGRRSLAGVVTCACLLAAGFLPPSASTALAVGALSITTPSSPTSPPNATVGKSYSFALRASGGDGTYAWAMASGQLPPGLSLSSTGVISGTPSATSENGGFTAQVSSSGKTAQKTFSVWANPAPVSPFGEAFCTAHGASSAMRGPNNIWACGPAAAGFSPATPYDTDGFQCVELSARYLSAVYGLPAPNDSLGNFTYGFEFVNSVATNPEHFKIDGKAIPETTTKPGNDVVPTPGDIVSFGASGAWGFAEPTAGHTAVVTTDPPGSDTPKGDFWILSQDFGSESEGFGTTVGEQELSINTTLGHVLMVGLSSAPTPFSWLVLPSPASTTTGPVSNPLTITTPSTASSPPNATVGQPYGFDLEASGPGDAPGLYQRTGKRLYYWTLVSGKLPPGLSLSSNGTIAGTVQSPSQGGPFTVQVSGDGQLAQQSFTVWALPANAGTSSHQTNTALQITSPSTIVVPDNAVVGTQYSSQFQAAGGTGSYTWSLALGSPPAGLALDPDPYTSSAGVIAGVPTAGSKSSIFVLKVKSGKTSIQKVFTIWVAVSCGTISSKPSSASNVQIVGLTCGQAKQLLAAGGPVEAPGWYGHSQCTFEYTATTFTPSCSLGDEDITYTAPLAGGKGG